MWHRCTGRSLPDSQHLCTNEDGGTSPLGLFHGTYPSHPFDQLPRCQKAMHDNCIDQFDVIGCNAAVNFCDSELSTGLWASGQSPSHQLSSCSRSSAQDAIPTTSRRPVLDFVHPSSPHLTPAVTQPCKGTLCYPENTAIASLLNNPSTRTLLGVTSPHNFTACSAAVSAGFRTHLDKWGMPAEAHVAGLLARGVRVLLYAGTFDWQCNWVANRMWVDKLAWGRAGEWGRGEWREWEVAGRAAGETKTAGPLTFATVRGAGHMISVFLFVCTCSGSVLMLGVFGRSHTTSPRKHRRWCRDGWLSRTYELLYRPIAEMWFTRVPNNMHAVRAGTYALALRRGLATTSFLQQHVPGGMRSSNSIVGHGPRPRI